MFPFRLSVDALGPFLKSEPENRTALQNIGSLFKGDPASLWTRAARRIFSETANDALKLAGVEKGGQMPRDILEERRRALSPREAERTLGISHATLYRLIKAGRLRTIKLGSRTVIPVDAIDALLAGGAR
jgi:excisionase family DNA binding protein